MSKKFNELHVGNCIFSYSTCSGRIFIQTFKIDKIETSYDNIMFRDKTGRMTPFFRGAETQYVSWYSHYYTSLDDCIKSIPKTKQVVNIVSPQGHKVCFYNIRTRHIINGTWYDKKHPFTGFYQIHNRLFGIIEKQGALNVITIDGSPLCDRWYSNIQKKTKEGYLIGSNTVTKTKKKDNIKYTVTCTEEEKITLPASTLIQKCTKTTPD